MRRQTNIRNTQYEYNQTYTQYTGRRQTNIHNAQYEDKQTYTTHSTKTNKHTQYTVRRQTNIHKQTHTTQHRKLNICATLKEIKPREIKNGNPLGTNQNVRRQTKRKYTTQNRKLKS